MRSSEIEQFKIEMGEIRVSESNTLSVMLVGVIGSNGWLGCAHTHFESKSKVLAFGRRLQNVSIEIVGQLGNGAW